MSNRGAVRRTRRIGTMINQIKTILLMGALGALVVGAGAALSPRHMILFAVLAIAMNLGAYFFSDKIVLRMHGAQDISPGEMPALHAMVEELAARAGIPKPRVVLIPEMQPNAFATGRNPRHAVVAVTEGILQLLDHRQLRGVLAHELAHIKNRDVLLSTMAAAIASLVTWVAHALSFATFFGGSDDEDEGAGGLGGLLFILAAPVAATLIQLGISRSREYLADQTGAEISGDPEALASALVELDRTAHRVPANVSPATASLFIVNPLSGGAGALLTLFSTHPATSERVRRLMQMADRRARTSAPVLYAHQIW
jgi:heat shock protein HtpX